MAADKATGIPDSDQEALEFLVQHQRISRSDLATELGLTPQAVSQIVARLTDRGIDVAESDQATGRGGQPARIYELRVPGRVGAVAVDIGYHRTRVALCGSDGEVISGAPLIQQGLLQPDPAAVFDPARKAIAELLEDRNPNDVVGVGIAIAGPVNPDERMLRAGPQPGQWEASDLGKEIAARFPDYPGWKMEVGNDANLAAVAEHRSGVAMGYDTVVYVRWTVGIGSGLILAGRPFTGARGTAGELGHVVFPPADASDTEAGRRICPWCKNACLQSLAGTDAILAYAQNHGFRFSSTDDRPPAIADVIAAAEHDEAARVAITHAASYMGKMLAIVANLLNPQLIVIGGAFGRNDYSLVVPAIQQAMAVSTIQPAFRDVRIVMGNHSGSGGGGAVLRGAAMRLFDKHLATWLLR